MHPHDDQPLNDDLRTLLQRYQPPTAASGFFEQATQRALVESARQRQQTEQRRRRFMFGGVGGAMAASVLAWFFMTGTPATVSDAPELAVVNIALAEPETVNLLFSTSEALADAKLTIVLPPGVELAGFPGQREVSWHTSLAPGRNLLPLELLAVTGVGGELQAFLEHESREKAFHLQLRIG